MSWLEKASLKVTYWCGSSTAILLALLTIVVWAAIGPFTQPRFNDTWQLVINTFTTLVTFIMVFLIQRTQNKDSLVIQIKLNELLAATRASNRLIDLEQMSEEEVKKLHARYQELAKQAGRGNDPTKRTSVEQLESCANLEEKRSTPSEP